MKIRNLVGNQMLRSWRILVMKISDTLHKTKLEAELHRIADTVRNLRYRNRKRCVGMQLACNAVTDFEIVFYEMRGEH